MSESTAKAERRDLRRAVGSDAVGVIDAHTLAIDHQILPNLNALHAKIADYDTRFAAHDKRVGEERTARLKMADEQRMYVDHEDWLLRRSVAMLSEDVTAWRAFRLRTFWQRLRWLLTGK